jgi:hypothetical protein
MARCRSVQKTDAKPHGQLTSEPCRRTYAPQKLHSAEDG